MQGPNSLSCLAVNKAPFNCFPSSASLSLFIWANSVLMALDYHSWKIISMSKQAMNYFPHPHTLWSSSLSLEYCEFSFAPIAGEVMKTSTISLGLVLIVRGQGTAELKERDLPGIRQNITSWTKDNRLGIFADSFALELHPAGVNGEIWVGNHIQVTK